MSTTHLGVYHALVAQLRDGQPGQLLPAAGISITARYYPAQPNAVMPPRYPVPHQRSDSGGMTREVHYIRRYAQVDGQLRETVLIDSRASQASRIESALWAVRIRGDLPGPARIPVFRLNLESVRAAIESSLGHVPFLPDLNSLTLPHRCYDGYFRYARLVDSNKLLRDDPRFRAIFYGTADDVQTLFRHCPNALVFGGMEGGARNARRIPRAYMSEMLGLEANPPASLAAQTGGHPAGSGRFDPTPLPGNFDWGLNPTKPDKKIDKTSKLAIGMIPPTVRRDGGVTSPVLLREAWLSFPILRQLRLAPHVSADQNAQMRAVLAAVALYGDRLAFGGPFTLRSGCDVAAVIDEHVALLHADGSRDEGALSGLTVAVARDLLVHAVTELFSAGPGFTWQDVELVPDDTLRKALVEGFQTAAAEGDGGDDGA